MEITLTRGTLDWLLAEAAKAARNECCGVLLGRDGVVEQATAAANLATDPLRHFEIDPQVLIDAYRAARDGGLPVLGYYHSHPNGHPVPSATDCQHAGSGGAVWAIVAAGEVRLWQEKAGGFDPLSYRVTVG